MSKFLYPIYKLKTKSYIKWWLYHKKAGGSGILSEILQGFSFNLENTLNRKFNLFEIQGNSVQDGTPNPDNEVPIYSAGDNGSINEKITNSDGTKEQDYSIFVQQPMRSIGDVRDCFVKKSDGWYERHYIGRKIFTGTENLIYLDNHGNYYRYYILNFQNGTGIRPVLSNYFIDRGNQAFGEYNFIQLTGNDFYLQIENITTLEDLKTWLSEQYASGNPVYVDYLLAEPLDLPCTEEQIQQLVNKPSTYKDFTIIQSEDETPAHLTIQYYKEG